MKKNPLFVPRKTTKKAHPGYGTDMRAIETAFNALPTPPPPPSLIHNILAGAGVTVSPTPGDLAASDVTISASGSTAVRPHAYYRVTASGPLTYDRFAIAWAFNPFPAPAVTRHASPATYNPLSFTTTGPDLFIQVPKETWITGSASADMTVIPTSATHPLPVAFRLLSGTTISQSSLYIPAPLPVGVTRYEGAPSLAVVLITFATPGGFYLAPSVRGLLTGAPAHRNVASAGCSFTATFQVVTLT